MKRLLVGVDGSAGSMQALRWASLLARQTGADLTLACVAVAPQIEMTPGTTAEVRSALESRAEKDWGPIARQEGVACTISVLDGDPADALLRAAVDTDVDLVVLGARGTGGFDGLRLGSVADHVAHHTARPLAVIPESAEPPRLRSILVGVDESDGSAAAVDYAAELASGTGADVTAVYVYYRPAEFWSHKDARSQYAKSEEFLETVWTEPLRETGRAVTTRVVENAHTAEGLLAAAADADADVLVVGTRSLGSVLHLRLGGVAMKLLHNTDRPVLVVPPKRS